MLTVHPVVIAEARVPAQRRGCPRPPALSRPRSRHRPAEGAGRGAPSRSEPCPAPRARHATVTRHPPLLRTQQSSPSPSIPLLPTCPFPSWRLSTAPATVDRQNAIAKRATCHTLAPPAVNRNCFLRRLPTDAERRACLAHDAAAPSPLTSFLCSTPAPRASVRHAGLTGEGAHTLALRASQRRRRTRMLTRAPCAAPSTAVSLTESTSWMTRTWQ